MIFIIREWANRPCGICKNREGCLYNKAIVGAAELEPNFVKKGMLEHSCKDGVK